MLMLKLVILCCYVQAGRMSAITIHSDQRHTTTATAVLTSLGAKKSSDQSCTACGTNCKTHQKSSAPCTTVRLPQLHRFAT